MTMRIKFRLMLAALLLASANLAWAAGGFEVTDKIVAAVKGNALKIVADNKVFVDPAHGQIKQLRVEYSVGETVLTNTVAEKAVLRIGPPPGKRLIILKATYGVF